MVITGCRDYYDDNLEPVKDSVVAELIYDYQLWMEDNLGILDEELSEVEGWDHDISYLAEQSWNSEYFIEEDYPGPENVMAYALPARGRIILITAHPIWDFVLNDYENIKSYYYRCELGGDRWILQTSRGFNTLAHENAHNIFIEPHEDVYLLGDTVQYIRESHINVWKEECGI